MKCCKMPQKTQNVIPQFSKAVKTVQSSINRQNVGIEQMPLGSNVSEPYLQIK